MNLADSIRDACVRAKRASRILATAPTATKDRALRGIARGLRGNAPAILGENRADLDAGQARGLSAAMLDRLMLDEKRLEAIAKAVEEVAELADPTGDVLTDVARPSGLRVRRVRVPLGVIAMIYEARPNVTVDASALCLKAGNAVVLRGGSEALRSNLAMAHVIGDALVSEGLPRDSVQVLPFTDRDAVRHLVQQVELVDLAIPRGGEGLIRMVTEQARVPVVQHYKGVCHLYVDGGADVAMAVKLVANAKLSRPAVCNALECLLVDAADAARLLPPIAERLLSEGCELRACTRALALVPKARSAESGDFGREFLDKTLAIRVVDGIDGALAHVAEFGSGHTEAICTVHESNAERWRREVDAACVVVNASTRFHDGGELGLGAEIGIATSRVHWRGPMGLESLTTMKWVVDGHGETR